MKKILITLLLLLLPNLAFGAINAATLWEVRSTGASTNGGGFADLDPGTSVDYSPFDVAELTATDLVCAGSTAVVTSAGAGFTAAMVGNVIYISDTGDSTHFVIGYYQIVTYTSTSQVTLDRDPTDGTADAGGDFKVGGGTDNFENIATVRVAGNTVWIKGGSAISYNASGSKDYRGTDGSSTAPMTIEGYDTSRGNNPTTNRPTLALGSNYYLIGNWHTLKNLIVTTTAASYSLTPLDGNATMINVKVTNSSGTGNRPALYAGASSHFIGCEGISTAGQALKGSRNHVIDSCYLHDSLDGINTSNYDWYIINSVIDTCTTGLDLGTIYNVFMKGCTIYNCTTGIDATNANNCNFYNNIITECADGAIWTTEIPSNTWDYNCWNNTDDTDLVTIGTNAIEDDPLLTAPATGDFTLQSGSPCLDAGIDVGDCAGVTGDYKINIGVDQDDVSAGGTTNDVFGWID